MKSWFRSLAMIAFAIGCLTAPAGAQTLSFAPRVFVGAIYLGGDSDNWVGSLTAFNPTCTLTIANNHPNGGGNGVGPNGSLLLTGSSEAPECMNCS